MSFSAFSRVSAYTIVLVFVAASSSKAAYSFTAVDAPGAVHGTYLYGISGSEVVGTYWDANDSSHGFALAGGTFESIENPLAGTGYLQGTNVSGMSGSTAFGSYIDANNVQHGFTYDAGLFTSYNAPGAGGNSNQGTTIAAIDGGNYAGSYKSAAGTFGFVSTANGADFTTLSDPAAPTNTYVLGLAGNTVLGSYVDANNIRHGFIFDESTSTFTTIDDPSAGNALLQGTIVRSFLGGNFYGTFIDAKSVAHGFVYDGNSFETLDDPAGNASLQAVSDSMLVGFYHDPSTGGDRGFIAIAPEPSMMGIVFLGGSLLALRRRRISR